MARKPGKWVSVPEGHMIKIAKSTLRMNDVMAQVMGGMDKPTARAVLKKHGLYKGEVKRIDEIKENPRRQRRANPARSKRKSEVVDIREYGAGLVQWKIIKTSPHRFAVTQTDRTKFSTEKHHIILGVYTTQAKADKFLSGYIPEAKSVLQFRERLDARKNPPGMTLKDWSDKWKISPKKHSGGGLYFPGITYMDEPAKRELYRLDDYAVSSVSGGTLWLIPRKKNPHKRARRKK